MKLSLKNIGKIKEAVVEMSGITVIAGENNTGKSTVGKVLYSVFNSFYDIERQIQKERERSIENVLYNFYDNTNYLSNYDDIGLMSERIMRHVEIAGEEYDTLKKLIEAIFKEYIEERAGESVGESYDIYIEKVCDLLEVPEEAVFISLLNKKLDTEFKGQVSNVYSDDMGEIVLRIKDKEMKIKVSEYGVQKVNDSIVLKTEAIYIDDPFVLDELASGRIVRISPHLNHKSHLKNKLNANKHVNVFEEIVNANKFDKIYKMLDSVCDGDMVRNKRAMWVYQKKNSDKFLDVRNLSTGLKTFVILKQLFLNGTLEANGTIILDEPEIHLHPEWQLLFAELIVLLQKEFGMHILLNTHSPYFLNAIEVYAAKYEIADKCKYYMAENIDDCSVIRDVTNDIESIYAKLARPLQRLENERYMND